MSAGDEIFRRLQSAARSVSARTGVATPTQAYLNRHLIESFLERLTRTVHDRDFVLKGGILLGAYGVRRPTKDADSNAISVDVTAEQLRDVIDDVAQVVVDDGVTFDATSRTRSPSSRPTSTRSSPAVLGRDFAARSPGIRDNILTTFHVNMAESVCIRVSP